MSTNLQSPQADVAATNRLPLFVAVFAAGIVGGAVFTNAVAHSRQAQPQLAVHASSGQTGDAIVYNADPSVPDAGMVLRHRRSDRPEPVAPTF